MTVFYGSKGTLSESYYIAPGDYAEPQWDGYDESEYALCTDGKATQSSIDSPEQFLSGADIAVGCCAIDGSTGYRPDCDAVATTYAEAKAICEDYGYRLCTLQEMLWDRITEGKGCQFDWAYCWTSDECES